MKTIFIVNDPPYGTERCYNALRRAQTLTKVGPETEITVFLMTDAAVLARNSQEIRF